MEEVGSSFDDLEIEEAEGTVVTLIHYNDVYDVEPQNKEPIGGAARFCAAIKSFAHLDPLVVFSGDCFSPSLLSSITKGEQMIPVLNAVGTKVAVYGNHEFDFGVDILSDLVQRTNFPWLMSNVIDNETELPLGNGKVTHILENNGKKIGFMGLVEWEWMETLSTLDPDCLTFRDFVEVGSELATQLRSEGCDFVIALTHMRQPNDTILAEKAIGIDLILGGHDHVFSLHKVNGVTILKSGTDFRDFSVVNVKWPKNENEKPRIDIQRISVTSDYNEDPDLKAELEQYSKLMDSKMNDVLGEFHCELDGRFASVRTSETNLGNFMCDIMVASTNADCAILNSGTLRSDRIHSMGNFTRRDLLTVLPLMDSLIVLNVSGSQIVDALENGVSQYPKLEGRFPQISGIKFAFNPKHPVGSRVDPKFVMIGDEYLQLNNKYRLVTKSYVATGHDGYTCLCGSEVLADEEACLELSTAVQNHFHAIEMVSGHNCRRNSRHHQSLVTLSRRHSLLRSMSSMGGGHDLSLSPGPNPHHLDRGMSLCLSPRPSLSRQGNVVDTIERNTCKLEPKIEGRITIISSKQIYIELCNQRKEWELNKTIAEEDESGSPTSPTADKVMDRLRAIHSAAVKKQNNSDSGLSVSGTSSRETSPASGIGSNVPEFTFKVESN